jgi:hypothetical protein
MIHPHALIVIGSLALLWVLSKEPRLRGGKTISRPIKQLIIILAVVMIGFGFWEVLRR